MTFMGLRLGIPMLQQSGGGGGSSPITLDFTSGIPAGVNGSGGANGTAYNASNNIAAATAPRLDYGNGFDGVDRAPANCVLQGNSPSTSPWVTSGTAPTLSASGTLPSGRTATQGVFASSTGAAKSKIQQPVGVVPGVLHTMQVKVKGTVGGEVLALWVQHFESAFKTINLAQITATTSWVTYYATFVPDTSQVFLCFGTDGTFATPPTQAGGTVLFGEFQIEVGPAPSAYVDTTTLVAAGPAVSGLLVEPARTNFALQSNTFNNAAWAVNVTSAKTVTFGAATTGPDGVASSAARVTYSATTGANQTCNISQTVTGLTAGVLNQVSLWVKGNAGTEVIYLGAQDGLTPFASLGFQRILANKFWQRITLAFVPSGTSALIKIGSDTNTPPAQANAAGGTVFLYNCQVETGELPTSDIITTSAGVTRTADAITLTVPAGQDTLNFTYADGSVQMVPATSGAYTIQTNLNGRRISTIVSSARSSSPISSVTFGTPFRYNQGYALKSVDSDVWSNTWAANDKIYVVSDDYAGWQTLGSANMAMSTLTDATLNTVGTILNPMAAFGAESAVSPTDNASWKSAGMISVNGVLYDWACRQVYGTSGTQFIQTSISAQLLKSTDKGVTWTPQPPSTGEPLASPMFTSPKFSAPFFVQYGGRDYQNNGVDNADTYAYAASPEAQGGASGVWNNGSKMYLGRCLISALGNQSAADWSFYTGGDGMLDANWTATVANAVAIMTNTNKIGMNGIQYLPYCKRYICLQWFYPSLPSPSVTTSITQWDVWEAPAPWGPWTLQQSVTWNPLGLYNGNVMPKSVSVDNGKTILVSCAGDYHATNAQTGYYTLILVPVTVNN